MNKQNWNAVVKIYRLDKHADVDQLDYFLAIIEWVIRMRAFDWNFHIKIPYYQTLHPTFFHSIWRGPTESAKKISKSTAMASILAKTKVYQSNGWSCQKGRNGRWLVSFILWQKSSLFRASNPCFSSLHIIDEASNSTRVITLKESNLTLSWVSYCPPVFSEETRYSSN